MSAPRPSRIPDISVRKDLLYGVPRLDGAVGDDVYKTVDRAVSGPVTRAVTVAVWAPVYRTKVQRGVLGPPDLERILALTRRGTRE